MSIAIVLGVMFLLDFIGYTRQKSIYNVAGGMLGVFTTGWVFNNGYVVYQSVYSGGAWVNQTVDANLIVVVLAVVTIASFMSVYLERYA